MKQNKFRAVFMIFIACMTILSLASSPKEIDRASNQGDSAVNVADVFPLIYKPYYIKEDMVIKEKEQKTFLKDVAKVIKKIKLQHPDIVLAQAMEESGHWKSSRFRDHNNMFGMKKASSRPTLASDYDRSGYAIYTKWEHSVYDYALYQSAYARGLSREAYFKKLESYCEVPGYAKRLKAIININHLTDVF